MSVDGIIFVPHLQVIEFYQAESGVLFFDGLIADWCVLSNIHDTQESISRIKDQVCGAFVGLEKIKASHGQTF